MSLIGFGNFRFGSNFLVFVWFTRVGTSLLAPFWLPILIVRTASQKRDYGRHCNEARKRMSPRKYY